MAKVDFPSNSEKQEVEREALQPITQARLNESKGKKLSAIFLAEDINDAGDYFVRKILGPAVRMFLSNLGKDIIDLIFYGQALGSVPDRSGSRNRERYSNVTKTGSIERTEKPKARTTGSIYEDPIVPSRGKAELVLDDLAGTADEYGFARVLDLYELCGLETQFTQMNWGWTPEQINQARVLPIHRFGADDEFIIKLPKPIQID